MTCINSYPVTPDGRYFVVKNRLWRCSNPQLTEAERASYVKALMAARAAVKHASSDDDISIARAHVHEAKIKLGERGPVWWNDGSKDVNRYHPKNTVYADWWSGLDTRRHHMERYFASHLFNITLIICHNCVAAKR